MAWVPFGFFPFRDRTTQHWEVGGLEGLCSFPLSFPL